MVTHPGNNISRMPLLVEDYYMGFKASLVMHDQCMVHVNISTFLAEAPL
jgi:hypothetical protein